MIRLSIKVLVYLIRDWKHIAYLCKVHHSRTVLIFFLRRLSGLIN